MKLRLQRLIASELNRTSVQQRKSFIKEMKPLEFIIIVVVVVVVVVLLLLSYY